MKKITSLILAMAMVFSLSAQVFALNDDMQDNENSEANMIGSVPVRFIEKLSASLGDRIAFTINFCPFLSAGKAFHRYEDCSVSLLNP